MKRVVCIAVTVSVLAGCSPANLHLRETPAWAKDLYDDQLCFQASITPGASDKGRLLANELRERAALKGLNLEQCAITGSAAAQQHFDRQRSIDEFLRGVGTAMGVAIGVAAVGAAGYYSATPPAPSYGPPPANKPPLKPIGMALLAQRSIYSNGQTQIQCDYGRAGQIIMPTGSTCPANYPY